MQFLDALDGLIEIEPLFSRRTFCVRPDQFVANPLRQTLPEFLMAPAKSDSLTKFIAERQDTENMRTFRLAS